MMKFFKEALSGELGLAKSFWLLVMLGGIGLKQLYNFVILPLSFNQGFSAASISSWLLITWFLFAAYCTVRAVFFYGRPSGWGWLALLAVFLFFCNGVYEQYVRYFSSPTWNALVLNLMTQKMNLPMSMAQTGLILEEIGWDDETRSVSFQYRLPDTSTDSYRNNNAERAAQWKSELIATRCPFEREYLGSPTNELNFVYIAQDESELSVTIYPEDCGIYGEFDGPYENFYDNGQLEMRGNLTDGELNGLWEWFDENGQLWVRTNYIDGKEEGLSEEFDENGNLIRTETWRNGELIEENDNP